MRTQYIGWGNLLKLVLELSMHLLMLGYLRHFSLMTSNDSIIKIAVLKPAWSRTFLTDTATVAESIFS